MTLDSEIHEQIRRQIWKFAVDITALDDAFEDFCGATAGRGADVATLGKLAEIADQLHAAAKAIRRTHERFAQQAEPDSPGPVNEREEPQQPSGLPAGVDETLQ